MEETAPARQRKQSLPRTKRAPADKLPSFTLTRRDAELLKAIATYRILSSVQLATLFFPHTTQKRMVSSRLLHRLQVLYHAGFVERLKQPTLSTEGRKPFLYTLDTKGAQLIEELTEEPLDWKKRDNTLSYLFLDHLLKTNDIRIAIALSVAKNRYTLEEWIDDKTLKNAQMKDTVTIKTDAGNTSKTAIVPDGYFRIVVPTLQGKERVFHGFVECDMGTMTAKASVWGRRDFRHKILAYTAYINSGMYEARYGAKTMRVLTVTTTEDRLKTLKKVTEDAGGKNRFWFTTFGRIYGKDILSDYLWSTATKEGLFSFVEPPQT